MLNPLALSFCFFVFASSVFFFRFISFRFPFFPLLGFPNEEIGRQRLLHHGPWHGFSPVAGGWHTSYPAGGGVFLFCATFSSKEFAEREKLGKKIIWNQIEKLREMIPEKTDVLEIFGILHNNITLKYIEQISLRPRTSDSVNVLNES